jgi:hypothetical protein
VIVYGLRAGWTLEEIISHEDIKKNTFKAVLKRKIGKLFATRGSADVLITRRKVYKKLSDCMWTFLASTLQELITWNPWGRPKPTLGQKLNIFRTTVRKDVAGGLEIQILCYEERSIYVRAFTGKEEDSGLAQEVPLGGVGEEGLASQLT